MAALQLGTTEGAWAVALAGEHSAALAARLEAPSQPLVLHHAIGDATAEVCGQCGGSIMRGRRAVRRQRTLPQCH
jgi:hypothetical protein